MKDTEKAARRTLPIAAADTTARTGVHRIALTGSAQTTTLPTTGKAKGMASTVGARWIRLLADGANVQIAGGVGSAPTIVLDQTAAVGTGNAGAGITLVSGVPDEFLIGSEVTHLGFISDAASGFLEWAVTDSPVV